jgi:3alpha(or 20beta)-hydroxysteroid dehydrogenase
MAAARLSDVAVSRIADPNELTRLVLLIACDEVSFSTGSEFIAAGGMLLGPVPDSSPRA